MTATCRQVKGASVGRKFPSVESYRTVVVTPSFRGVGSWEFGYGGAVFAWVGRSVIDASAEIAHDGLAAAERIGEAIVHPKHVSLGLELRLHVARNTVLEVKL